LQYSSALVFDDLKEIVLGNHELVAKFSIALIDPQPYIKIVGTQT
jgi:hypothetical protein